MFGKKKDKQTGANTAAVSEKKKKSAWKWIILAAIAVAAVFIVLRVMNQGKSAGTIVETMVVSKGNIEEIVSLSGTVESAKTMDYYAAYSARVASAGLKDGGRVKAGDVLIAYDKEELELAKKQAELNLQQADGTYDDSISKEQKALSKKYTADKTLPGIEADIDAKQARIDELNEMIRQKQHRMAEVGLQLQQTMYDINQNGRSDGPDDPSYADTKAENGNDLYLELQKSVAQNSYAQNNDEEIMGWNKQINDLNDEITKLNEKKTELKSDQTAGENASLTDGGKSSMEAQREISRLTNEKTLRDIEKAEDGIKAGFSGVVTDIAVEAGAVPAQGAKLFKLSSTEDVKVVIQISKSDLSKIKTGQSVDITVSGKPYKGEVSWISGSATRNSSNVPVVAAEIKVLDPDDALVLGVEANLKIHTAKADNVPVLPYENVNTDTHGDFVYVVNEGILTRRDVKTGITTSTDAEIVEGLSEGDEIVTGDVSALEEGMSVIVSPAAGN